MSADNITTTMAAFVFQEPDPRLIYAKKEDTDRWTVTCYGTKALSHWERIFLQPARMGDHFRLFGQCRTCGNIFWRSIGEE